MKPMPVGAASDEPSPAALEAMPLGATPDSGEEVGLVHSRIPAGLRHASGQGGRGGRCRLVPVALAFFGLGLAGGYLVRPSPAAAPHPEPPDARCAQAEASALAAMQASLDSPGRALPAWIGERGGGAGRMCPGRVLRRSSVARGTQVDIGGPSAEDVMEHIVRHMPQGLLNYSAIDIGANFGQFAIPLAAKGFHVYSFEPVQSTCAELKSRIRVAGVQTRVSVHCFGVAEKRETKHFGYVGVPVPPASFRMVDPHEADVTVVTTVQVAPITDVFRSEQVPPMLLFKTDTQGHEEEVLRGAAEVIRTWRPKFLFIELSAGLLKSAGSSVMAVLRLADELGYSCTHLAFHGMVAPGKFATIDTPRSIEFGPGDSVTFEALAGALEGRGLEPLAYRGKPAAAKTGWTDLMCV